MLSHAGATLSLEGYRDRGVLHGSPFVICFSAGTHCELYKDPCANISCLNGGTCDSEGLNGTCICAPGFTGEWSMSVFSNSLHSPMAAEVGQPQTFCHEWLQSRDAIVKCQGHGFNKIHFKTIDYVVIKLGSSEASISHLDLLALPSLYVSRAGALKHKPWAHENTCKCQCSCSMNGTGRIKHVFCVNSIQTPLSVIKVTVLVLGRKDSG